MEVYRSLQQLVIEELQEQNDDLTTYSLNESLETIAKNLVKNFSDYWQGPVTVQIVKEKKGKKNAV